MELIEQLSTYNVEMQLYYLDINSFKEKQTYMIINTIGACRIGNYMSFKCYANLKFDEEDTKHKSPIITELSGFTRGKTNCLVYDLNYNTYNNGQYDKLFIFMTTSKKELYYSYIFYNTKTGKCFHKFLIPDLIDELVISINNYLYDLLNTVYINFYLKKNKDLDLFKKGLKSNDKLYGNLLDYKEMLQEYQDRINIGKSPQVFAV